MLPTGLGTGADPRDLARSDTQAYGRGLKEDGQ